MKKGKILVLVSIFLTLISFTTYAKEKGNYKLSLNQCMEYAVEHNTRVKIQGLYNENYRQDRITTIASLFPSISSSTGLNVNYGRSIDPVTNTYTTEGSLGNSYGINAGVTVFNGFSNINNVRISKLMQLIGRERVKQLEDDVALKTMRVYFDVVYYLSSVEIAKEQLETVQETLRQSKKKFELGRVSAADVAQIESQVASDDLLVTRQQNQLELALLDLKESMNYPIEDKIEVETSGLFDEIMIEGKTSEVLEYAMKYNPRIVESKHNIRQRELDYKSAKGRYAPSINLNGGINSGFNKRLNASSASFNEQFSNNLGYGFGVSISIPIFGGLNRRVSVAKMRNNLNIAEQNNLEIERLLHREIQQAIIEKSNYGKEFIKAYKAVEASGLAHKASVKKFEKGMVSSIDMQITANTLLIAKSDKLKSRLQYIIRSRIVNYYGGEPLIK